MISGKKKNTSKMAEKLLYLREKIWTIWRIMLLYPDNLRIFVEFLHVKLPKSEGMFY